MKNRHKKTNTTIVEKTSSRDRPKEDEGKSGIISRVFFIDEDGNDLQVTDSDITQNPKPIRFRGVLDMNLLVGDILLGPDGEEFEIIKRKHALAKNKSRIPKHYFVLKKYEGSLNNK